MQLFDCGERGSRQVQLSAEALYNSWLSTFHPRHFPSTSQRLSKLGAFGCLWIQKNCHHSFFVRTEAPKPTNGSSGTAIKCPLFSSFWLSVVHFLILPATDFSCQAFRKYFFLQHFQLKIFLSLNYLTTTTFNGTKFCKCAMLKSCLV